MTAFSVIEVEQCTDEVVDGWDRTARLAIRLGDKRHVAALRELRVRFETVRTRIDALPGKITWSVQGRPKGNRSRRRSLSNT